MNEAKKKKQRRDETQTAEQTSGDPQESQPVEVVSLDVDADEQETAELDEETTLELLRQAEQEEYADEVAEYTADIDVQESLVERQALDSGEHELVERLKEHHATSPKLSGGDLDAAWDQANVGDETAGGTAATPDQDRVDEFGEAYGIEYEDDEPLHTGEKLAERDEERWELDPASADEASSE